MCQKPQFNTIKSKLIAFLRNLTSNLLIKQNLGVPLQPFLQHLGVLARHKSYKTLLFICTYNTNNLFI